MRAQGLEERVDSLAVRTCALFGLQISANNQVRRYQLKGRIGGGVPREGLTSLRSFVVIRGLSSRG